MSSGDSLARRVGAKPARLAPPPATVGRPVPSSRPGVAQIRLVGPAEVVEAAMASLAEHYGALWQCSDPAPSRRSAHDRLVYGTLIVPLGAKP